jgi:regulator of protease activity HflC (stomatin/prohibitin superfamily)
MEIFAGAILLFAVILVFRSVVQVPQGSQYTVERFRRYVETLRPGLHLIVPLIDSIGAKVSVKETVLDVPSQEVITKDNAMVRCDGVVFFQVMDVAKAAYEVSDLSNAILNLVMTNIRSVMGSMDLDELLSNREHINTRLLGVVDEATSPWGVRITRVEIRDISPPRDLVDAMASQMKAERNKRAQILDAEGFRQAEILKAEGAKQAAILEAEGKREAAFREAEARERAAEAEAKATSMVSNAIGDGNSAAINYFVAQEYIKALGQFASSSNQKIIFMPLETSGVIGSLGGMLELLKDGGVSPNSGVKIPSVNNPWKKGE